MLLTYKDLSRLFPKSSGIKDDNLSFQTVSSLSIHNQPKGLFMPFSQESGELKDAITNGAIAAIWKEGINIPKYTPNHFPIFYCEDFVIGLKNILILYREKLQEMDNKQMDKTDFLFIDKKLLNKYYETYDNAVMESILTSLNIGTEEGEGDIL